MKKLILTSALALAVTAGSIAPAHAGQTEAHDDWIEVQSTSWSNYNNSFGCIPVGILIGLLLPAIQSGRG